MAVTSQTLVTDAELAELLGVSARRVRQMAEIGTLERTERGRYELGASIRALLDHAAGTGSELQKERTRKVRADADMAEMELALRRGELAHVDLYRRVWLHRCMLIQQRMQQIPQRIVTRILGETSESRMKAALRNEITLALTDAARPVSPSELNEKTPEGTKDEQIND